MSSIVPKSQMQLVDPQAQIIVDFLKNIGLPHDNIIAAQDQRAIIGLNLPAYIESLPAHVKQGARIYRSSSSVPVLGFLTIH